MNHPIQAQSGAIVEPEKVAPLPEYQGTQAGAIVEPEAHASLPEYKGEQSGAVVAPETADKPEYTGINLEPSSNQNRHHRNHPIRVP